MLNLSQWKLDYNDGGSKGPGVIFRHLLAPELTTRLVWVFYDQTGVPSSATMVGKEAWLKFWLGSDEVVKLPVCLVPALNVRMGIGSYNLIWDEHRGTGAGSLFWDNAATSREHVIQPFPVVIEADSVTLEHDMPAAVNRSLLAVLSLPPR
jgi:hypothetical protein